MLCTKRLNVVHVYNFLCLLLAWIKASKHLHFFWYKQNIKCFFRVCFYNCFVLCRAPPFTNARRWKLGGKFLNYENEGRLQRQKPHRMIYGERKNCEMSTARVKTVDECLIKCKGGRRGGNRAWNSFPAKCFPKTNFKPQSWCNFGPNLQVSPFEIIGVAGGSKIRI